MPKIKDISNELLETYLEAYSKEVSLSPNNKKTSFTRDAIEKALKDRSLLGIQKEPKKASFLTKLLETLKR